MMRNNWKKIAAACAAALMLSSVSSAASAFDDLDGIPQAAGIMELKEAGVVSGIGNGKFDPRSALAARDAVLLIVRALDLNLDRFRFIKQPEASDAFDNIPNDAWYAEAFIIAHLNGVPLARDIDPNAAVTREQFALWLMSAVESKGPFAWIEIYHLLEDEAEVSEGYMGAVQRALIAGIAHADASGRFRPKAEITRAEAAEMARNAMRFVQDAAAVEPLQPDPMETGDVTPSVEAVTPEISKIVLDMGERPHPGWSVRILGIDFVDEDTAVVRYSVSYPDPAALYPMVISHPKAEQYIASVYTDIRYVHVGPGVIGGGASISPAEPEPGIGLPPDVPLPDTPVRGPAVEYVSP